MIETSDFYRFIIAGSGAFLLILIILIPIGAVVSLITSVIYTAQFIEAKRSDKVLFYARRRLIISLVVFVLLLAGTGFISWGYVTNNGL